MSPQTASKPFQPLYGNTDRELEAAIAHFDKRLRRAARLIAVGKRNLAEELYQRAITYLWELDPARFDVRDEGYIWRAMVSRMLNARRQRAGDPTRPPLAIRLP